MQSSHYFLPLAVFTLLMLPACDKPTTPAGTEMSEGAQTAIGDLERQDSEAAEADETAERIPFDDAELFFELNTTDDDLGLQLFLDAAGWRRVRVVDPGENEIAELIARGRLARLGITELRFESAEPSPAEVLARFPEGLYKFRGRSVDGKILASNAELSHDFLPAPTFTPSGGEVVDPLRTVVRWNAPGAEQVELIIEQEELEHVLDITVSGTTSRMRVPPQFLTPGKEYKIEILAKGENGNRTLAESTFRTAAP
jgi:hypothetical protein